MRVLVAVPYRRNTPSRFIAQTRAHFAGLTFARRELAMMSNELQDGSRRYGPNAMARNLLLIEHLRDDFTHVLWMDVDLVNVPHDLIERLSEISETDIVAPFVFVERIRPGEPSFQNGGWFYDTGGFVRNGEHARPFPPHLAGHGVMEMQSVGTCYLAPADVYRRGCRYEPAGDDVEHVSMMAEARALGYRVWATDAVQVMHAYLPLYGVAWHG